jgi:hypothetical protein
MRQAQQKQNRKYLKGEGGQVVMNTGDMPDVSRRKKEEFMPMTGR